MNTRQYYYFFTFIYCTFFSTTSSCYWKISESERQSIHTKIACIGNKIINEKERDFDETESSLKKEYQTAKDKLGHYLFFAEEPRQTSWLLCRSANPHVRKEATYALDYHKKKVNGLVDEDEWTPAHLFAACGMLSSLKTLQTRFNIHSLSSKKGYTPLNIATLYSQQATIIYLKSLQSKIPAHKDKRIFQAKKRLTSL